MKRISDITSKAHVKHITMSIMFIFAVFLLTVFGTARFSYALNCGKYTPDNIVDIIRANPGFSVIKGDANFDDEFQAIRQKWPWNSDERAQKIVYSHVKGVNLATGKHFENQVIFKQYCIGEHCGHTAPAQDQIMLIHQGYSGDVLHVKPCGGRIFRDVSEQVIAEIRACFKNGACKDISLNRV